MPTWWSYGSISCFNIVWLEQIHGFPFFHLPTTLHLPIQLVLLGSFSAFGTNQHVCVCVLSSLLPTMSSQSHQNYPINVVTAINCMVNLHLQATSITLWASI